MSSPSRRVLSRVLDAYEAPPLLPSEIVGAAALSAPTRFIGRRVARWPDGVIAMVSARPSAEELVIAYFDGRTVRTELLNEILFDSNVFAADDAAHAVATPVDPGRPL